MSYRELKIETHRYTKIVCFNEPRTNGACHEYQIFSVPKGNEEQELFARVWFQTGAIEEIGVNGCQDEDLIAIVLDRLYGFQSGEFACTENAIAITKLEDALLALDNRTAERQARGVE